MSTKLEDTFNVCPECRVPWSLHWVYIREGGELKRKYNTCGWTDAELTAKWLLGKTVTP